MSAIEEGNRKDFDVYEHFNLGFVAVKSGFSWPAFFCGKPNKPNGDLTCDLNQPPLWYASWRRVNMALSGFRVSGSSRDHRTR